MNTVEALFRIVLGLALIGFGLCIAAFGGIMLWLLLG